MDCRGVDLVSPLDRMPAGSFPAITNCRVQQEGRIEARPGYSLYSDIQGGAPFPPTVTVHDSAIPPITPGDYDAGCLAFDGTNFWQATTAGGNLLLLKYDSAGAFVNDYTIAVSNWSSTTFAPIHSFGGFLWVGGIASGGADTLAALAKITVTAGTPSLTAQIDVAPSGTITTVNGITDDGVDIYVLATYTPAHVAITKLTTAAAQVWQTTHAWSTAFSNIIYDGTNLYYAIDSVLYQVRTSDGAVVLSNTLTSTFIAALVYSTFGGVIWAYDSGPQNIYQISTSTLAISVTIPFTDPTNFFPITVDPSGNVWFIVTSQINNQGTLFVYDPTGVTQLYTYSFPAPGSPNVKNNTPEFIIPVGNCVWGGIMQSGSVTYGLVEFCEGSGGPRLLHSIRRLNDPDDSNTPDGYTYVVGNGTTLMQGPQGNIAQIDTAYSGDPLSILLFRPEVSPESWAYIYDALKQVKMRPDGVLRPIGVAPPNAAPTAEYGVPAWVQLHDGQTTTSWTQTGIDTINVTPQDRTGGDPGADIGFVIPDGSIPGWASIQSSSVQPAWWGKRMEININPGQPNAEIAVVRDIVGGISYIYTIAAIQYDAGTTGFASVVLNAGSGQANVLRNQVLQFVGGGGTELVRTLSVTQSPDGTAYSIRVELTHNHAAGDTVNSEQCWRVYLTQSHANNEPFTSKYVAFTHAAAGVGGGTYTFGSPLNASVANGRTIDPANDYMHISIYLAEVEHMVNLKILINFNTTPNFSFDSPGNSFIFTVTQADILAGELTGLGWIDLALPISSAQQTGVIETLNLGAVTGLAFQMTTTGSCNWGFDWWYLFGTYGPVVQPNAPLSAGYFYASTFRDSTTGCVSVPGPQTRYSLNPLREAVLVTPPTTTAAGVDSCDIYRIGGTLTTFNYDGTVVNNNSAPNSYLDGQADSIIAGNPQADPTKIQPWPLLGLPLSGTCDVNGTSIKLLTGTVPLALLADSAININGTIFQTYGQPLSTTALQTILDAGAQTNVPWSIQSPTVAGQPLPFAFGPLEGPFAPVAFALGDPVGGGTLYYSNTGDLDSASDLNTIEITVPSEPLISGAVWNGLVICGSRENLFSVRYSYLTTLGVATSSGPTVYQYAREQCPSGIWSRWACCRGPNGVYYLGRDGIYLANEQQSVCITDKKKLNIYPLFPHDGQQQGVPVNGYNPVDMTQLTKLRLSYADESIYFDYQDTMGNARTLRYEIVADRWFPHTYGDSIVYHYLNELAEGSPNAEQILMLSRSLGFIYINGGNDDNGVTLTHSWQTPSLDQGDERMQKLYVDAMVDADNTGTLTAALSFNNQTVSGPSVSLTLAGTRIQQFENIASLAALSLYRNISVLFSATGGPAGPRVYAFEPSGYEQPYLFTSHQTQYINLSAPGWKHHRRLYPGMISNASVTFTIETQDNRVFTITIPSTGGQFRIVPIMLPQNIKDLAFAYNWNAGSTPCAVFPEAFTIETKLWQEDEYLQLAILNA